MSLYGSSYGDIEALIARCAPKLMKSGSGLGAGAIREEARPKSTPGKRTAYRLISPEMGEEIMAMYFLGRGKTEIAAHFRISAEAVRTHISQKIVKKSPEELSELRSSPYRGVIQTRTK